MGNGTLRATQGVDTGGRSVKTPTAIAAATFVLLAGCGGSSGEPPAESSGTIASSGATGSSIPAAAFVGRYAGLLTIPRGNLTWTLPVVLAVESTAAGLVRLPVRALCPSLDHVDLEPPEAFLVALAEPGAWSMELPNGERVRLGAIHVRFDAAAGVLEVRLSGSVGGDPIEWSFVGAR
jgi:hypothetical protein